MKTKRITAILLAIITVISLGTTNAFAVSEANAKVPVKLTVVNEYRSINITVPASLPIAIYNGKVLTADKATIINKSLSGDVKISSVEIKNGKFKVAHYDKFDNLDNTVALKINGIISEGAGKLKLTDKAFPTLKAGNELKIDYLAKISGNVSNMKDTEIAEVIFTFTVVD